MPLYLVSKQTAGTTYSFRSTERFGWALCTVNDATGELLITSDWGNWSHRWDPNPACLGAPTLTSFIGTRGDVDYLARKLQREGRAGRRWSAVATVTALRQALCERRLEDGREQLEARLEPDEMRLAGGHQYDAAGLPIYSRRMPAEYRNGRPWDTSGAPYSPLPYLTRDTARRIWRMLGELADECGGGDGSLFYERIQHIDGFDEYVTTEPWEYGETEQTPEDRALRDIVLPALIAACGQSPVDQPIQPQVTT